MQTHWTSAQTEKSDERTLKVFGLLFNQHAAAEPEKPARKSSPLHVTLCS